MSHTILGGRAAISPSQLASMEAGTAPITAAALVALARALGTEVATLLDGVKGVALVRDHPLQPMLREAHGALRSWHALRQALEEHFGPARVPGRVSRRTTRSADAPASEAAPPPRSAGPQ